MSPYGLRTSVPGGLQHVRGRLRYDSGLETLGWTPRYDDLDTIVATSLAWERKIAAGDPGAYWAA